MAHYFLPAHVHFCARGDAFVFLDLRQDDYTLIDGRSAAAIRVLCADGRPRGADALNDALNELLSAGLLTADPTKGKSVAPTLVELADDYWSTLKPTDAAHHAPSLLALRMRVHSGNNPFAPRPDRGSYRQGRGTQGALAFQQHGGPRRARQLTVVFQTLRSFFPRDYLCLFDSLALVNS